ncbi:hypothetical protein BE08_29725 [Sorangium cellulosum]|uniref:Lipoprotein n=1 Tax=Sorangium cellulosum TaxID=56 RepID=A0A150PLR9_SORCE|nr:hypothetical protein BE08_29725 [Sorangium cellulosum]
MRVRALTVLRALAVVVALPVALAACGKKAPLGSPCRADDDCASGLACHRAQCLHEGSARRLREEEQRASGAGGARKVGDRIEVEWKGAYKPAVITGVVAPGSYRVHFEGYDAQWDEVVTEARIKGGARSGSGQKASVPAASSAER